MEKLKTSPTNQLMSQRGSVMNGSYSTENVEGFVNGVGRYVGLDLEETLWLRALEFESYQNGCPPRKDPKLHLCEHHLDAMSAMFSSHSHERWALVIHYS